MTKSRISSILFLFFYCFLSIIGSLRALRIIYYVVFLYRWPSGQTLFSVVPPCIPCTPHSACVMELDLIRNVHLATKKSYCHLFRAIKFARTFFSMRPSGWGLWGGGRPVGGGRAASSGSGAAWSRTQLSGPQHEPGPRTWRRPAQPCQRESASLARTSEITHEHRPTFVTFCTPPPPPPPPLDGRVRGASFPSR